MVYEKLKEEVKKLIIDAENSANRIDEAIENCDAFKFSYLLGDTDEARGATMILSKIIPDDPEVKKMWLDATYAWKAAYKGRDKFDEKCTCKKR